MANKIITAHYSVDGVPALLLAPTIDIYQLDPILPTNNIHVVVNGLTTEIGGGWYRYDFSLYDSTKSYIFTIDGGNTLSPCDRYVHGGNESYVEDIAPAVWEERRSTHNASGTMGAAINTMLINDVAMAALLNTVLKFQRNRTKIDVANAQMILYDDDCQTPLHVWNLHDFNGLPNVQEVCERIPTTC
jgi:hypothetical protein